MSWPRPVLQLTASILSAACGQTPGIHRIRFKSPSVTGKTQLHTDLITEDDTVVNETDETDKQAGETSRCPVATVKEMTVER